VIQAGIAAIKGQHRLARGLAHMLTLTVNFPMFNAT
jgi:hypothetical protein